MPIINKKPLAPLVLYDTFTGLGPFASHVPDVAPAGSGWSILSGSFSDLNGSDILNYSSGTNARAIIDTGLNDFDLTARFRVIDAAQDEIVVIVRGNASLSSYIRPYLNSYADRVQFTVYGGGGGAFGSYPLTNNTYYTLRVLGWGKTIRMYVEGNYVAGSDANTTPGTYVGLSKLQATSGPIWDWVRVERIDQTEWKRITFIGDSITAANPGWFSPLCTSYHNGLTKPNNHAFPGAKAGGTDFANQVTSTVTEKDSMDFTLILIGTNDGSDFTANYIAQLINLWNTWPGRPIYVLGILNRNPDNNRKVFNGYILSAVASAQASGVNVTYWITDGWIDPLIDTNDGLHPNATGNAKIVAQVLARLP